MLLPSTVPSSELRLIKSLIALFIGLIIILIFIIAGLIYYLRQSEVDIRWQDVVMIWSKRHRSSLFKDKNRLYKRCTDKARLTGLSKNSKPATYFSGSNYINMEVEHNIIDLPTLIANLSDPKYLSTVQTEFNGIPFIQMPSMIGNKPENRKKNRYVYLTAYDFNRVKLLLDDNDENGENAKEVGQPEVEKEEASTNLKPTDYINASYIDGYNSLKSYIATQGPLPWTFNDFWKMMWQQECSQIVMLTGLYENGRIKCDQYWPENDEITYGKIKVKHVSTNTESPDFVSRRFLMTKDNESREVVHYHNINWPDHGAPESPKALIDLIETIESDGKQLEYKGPLVVHCSAGVGRTGTYIMVDIMIKMGLIENKFDMLGQLYLLRKQRTHMIETEDQYYFVHQALAWYFKTKNDNTNANKQSTENEILINVEDNDDRAIEP